MKKVVVVGGGVGGSLVARKLQHCADVTLIDAKEYFELSWAGLRCMVEPEFAKRSIFNHSEYLDNARIVTSTAVDIANNEVVTADGKLVSFDYLVIATGHVELTSLTRNSMLAHDRGQQTRAGRLRQYEAEHELIKSAKSILIVGGGPTSVELAGEIATDFPEKEVKLVHRGSRLLEFIGSEASKKALNWLTARKVEVILGQSVDFSSASDGVYETSGGERITADIRFDCTGQKMGSIWLKETHLHDSLDIHGRLVVDANLRVKGYKNIFGIGDITNIPEIKQGYLAQRHASVVAKNLNLLMAGKNDSKLAVYKAASPIAIVSLGRKEAVAQFFCFTSIGCFPGWVKSADLFVGKTRKQLGLNP